MHGSAIAPWRPRVGPRVVLCVLLLSCALSGPSAFAQGKSLRELAESIYGKEMGRVRTWYVGRLKDLEGKAAEAGAADLAKGLRAKLAEADPQAPTAPAPATAVNEPRVKALTTEWAAVEKDYSNRVIKVAETCFRNGLIGRAYDLMFDILRHNPDHPSARANLGQEKARVERDDVWLTHWEARLVKKGLADHPRFGWVPKKDFGQYDQGLFPADGRWIPVAEADAVHAPWSAAWKMETDHYQIVSNLGYREATAITRAAERLYRVFFRIFIGYFEQKQQAGVLFKYEEKPLDKKYRVFFFKDQKDYAAEYNAAHGRDPKGGADPRERPGFYTTADRTAHFWAGDRGVDYRTFYHEATHQLFYESRAGLGSSNGPGCWVVEGTACYMETVHEGAGGEPMAGDAKDGRNRQALRDLQAGKSEPVAKLLQMDDKAFQAGDASGHYAQAASFVWFLMDAEGGKYREDFVRYMTSIYLGKPVSLPAQLGMKVEEIEKAWKEFMLATAGK